MTDWNDYAEKHSSVISDDTLYLERMTHLHTLAPRMSSGTVQGGVLAILSMMLRPRRILDIGTFMGMSAINLAQGLAPDGSLTTIEYNPENFHKARQLIKGFPFMDRIDMILGDAEKYLASNNEVFDLIYIDANKEAYSSYYQLSIDRLKSGGVVILDNMMWSGKVLETSMDVKTQILHDLNVYISKDDRVHNVLLPFRDGLQMVVKK